MQTSKPYIFKIGCPETILQILEEQKRQLKKCFKVLARADFDRELVRRIDSGEVSLPAGANHWLLVPRWEIFSQYYGTAVEKVFAAVEYSSLGSFINHKENLFDGKGKPNLVQEPATVAFWEKIIQQQPGCDLLVVPSQLGHKHRSCSAYELLGRFLENEFGLGSYFVGISLLIMPEQLKKNDDLWIGCPGDHFGKYQATPCFYRREGRLGYGVLPRKKGISYLGQATAFLPPV